MRGPSGWRGNSKLRCDEIEGMLHDIDFSEIEKLFHTPIPELVELARLQARLAAQLEEELIDTGFLPENLKKNRKKFEG